MESGAERSKTQPPGEQSQLDIAIIGLGCQFPEAPNPLAFWQLIRRGGLTFRPIPASRWNHRLFFDDRPRTIDRTYVQQGAFLDDEELKQFAALHFGMAARRAQLTDPQHRLLLDAVRCAIQDAGYETRWFCRERTGVFVGASVSEHKELHLIRLRAMQLLDGGFGKKPGGISDGVEQSLVENVATTRAFSVPGNLLNMAAATVAQFYDLGGPAFAIDAACSSGLVALHNAVMHLRTKQLDLALAGGVYLNLLPDNLVGFARIGAISRAGACKPFDAAADGFLMGEGVGVVLLKRREDAQHDGDRIYALIKGSACNNDGRSEGPMTPRQGGQLAVLEAAYRDAGVAPSTIGYMEAHGTATTVGDLVEVGALRQLFEKSGWTPETGARTALGSVKANIGHTMSAAGIAGLLKAALALHHRILPPQPSVQEQNPKLGLVSPGESSGPFYLLRQAQYWDSPLDYPRRAAVSSFGFGGTNAHTVLEERPVRNERAAVQRSRSESRTEKGRAELVLLSAAQPSLVARQARELLDALPTIESEGGTLIDLAYTLSTARVAQDCRLAVVANSFSQLEERLKVAAVSVESASNSARPTPLGPGIWFVRGPTDASARRLALLFPGQGAQRVGMLREVYEQVPAFRQRLDELDTALGAELHRRLGGTLRSLLYPLAPLGDAEAAQSASLLEAERRLQATEACQPAMAAVELALCATLGQMRIEPAAVLGHSLGEFVAASVAGVLSAEECVRWLARRGLAMASLPLADPGAMASVAAPREEVAAVLHSLGPDHGQDGPEPVVIANLNHPQQIVISGSTRAVAVASSALAESGRRVTRLRVSHAFHSPLMRGLRSDLAVLLQRQPLSCPKLPFVSSTSAAMCPGTADAIAQLWLEHATAPVDFVSALRRLVSDPPDGCGARILLQVGGGSSLLSLAKGAIENAERVQFAALTDPEDDGLESMSNALGLLWAMGTPINFGVLFDARDVTLLSLPPTPLETQSYWVIEPGAGRPELLANLQPSGSTPPLKANASGESMDPLVALFREQVALLQEQNRMLRERGLASDAPSVSLPASTHGQPPQLPSAGSAPQSGLLAAPHIAPNLARREIAQRVHGTVARISGFPLTAIQPTQTLAGDLGFDSLMAAELEADLSTAFGNSGVLPRDFLGARTTIAELVEHLSRAQVDGQASSGEAVRAAPSTAFSSELRCFAPILVESPLVGPSAEPLPDVVLITRDSLGVAEALAARLEALGSRPLLAELSSDVELRGILESSAHGVGPIGGIIHLSALGAPPAIRGVGGLAGNLEGLLQPLIWAHRLARLQTDPELAKGGLFVVATAEGAVPQGGSGGASAPYPAIQAAALAGFAKALARERVDETVKAIHLQLEDGPEEMADALIAEIRGSDMISEVAWSARVRRAVDFVPAQTSSLALLGPEDVVLVTGGARGVGARLAMALGSRRCSLILVGRSDDGPTVQKTLQAVRESGGRAIYVQWDVTGPAGHILDSARESLGPITAIVHAAGVSEDAPLVAKDESSFRKVMRPKLDGLVETLRATENDPLRLVVLISSWAGHFGNASQTDYAAANAALSKIAGQLPAIRPGVSALALSYPPWEGTEMVNRIPRLAKDRLREQGVPFIEDRSGQAALFTALDSGAAGDVLLASEAPPRKKDRRHFVVLDRHNDVYLEDHQLGGHPVLPFAAAFELMARAAFDRGFSNAPLHVRQLELRQPVRVDRATLLTLTSHQLDPKGRELTVTLSAAPADAPRPFSRAPAYVGRFSLETGPSVPILDPNPLLPDAQQPSMSLEDFYGETTFHGPRLRAVTSIEKLSSAGIIGWVRTSRPADWIRRPAHDEWCVDPLALDGAFQLAAYWAWANLGRAGFPTGIAEYRQFALLTDGPLRVCLTLENVSGDEVQGTLLIQHRSGKTLATATGVRGDFKHRDPRFLRGRSVASGSPGEVTQAPAESNDAGSAVDSSAYVIEQFPEVVEFQERLEMLEGFGLKNPYFNVHQRVTNETALIDGRTMINWSSYNYLGLSGDAAVTRAAQEAIARYGTSVSASRVASGEKPLHGEFERELAAFLGTGSAVVMVSGHAAFVTVIGHVVGPSDLVVHDSLAHDCILGGAKMSGAKRRPFPHNDWQALDRALSQLRPHYRRVLIAIEGVYSMDGDIPDLPRLIEIKKKHRALLLVDEAHSIGVLGNTGRGIGEHFGVQRSDVDFWMGTLSKSLASCGGYVAGSRALIQFLKYTAPGFVFSVGISPPNAAAALEALRQIQRHPEKIRQLHQRASLFLQLAKARGVDTGFSGGSAVVPAILGNSMHALQVSEAMRQRGINVQPILYPAVEDSLARLRFFVTATHTEEQIRETVDALVDEIARVRASNGELQTASL